MSDMTPIAPRAAIARYAPAPRTPSRTSAGRRVARALAIACALYLAVAAVYATMNAWSAHGALAIGLVGGVAAIVFGLARMRFTGDVALILAASFAAQLGWGALIDPQPFGEFGVLFAQAARVARGDLEALTVLASAASPGATALYAGLIAVVGEDLQVLRAVIAMLWTLQTWLVWKIARDIAETRNAALAAAALFGLAPATIAAGALVSPDALLGVFALSAFYVLLSHRNRGLWKSAALCGVLLGAAFLVRPVAGAHLMAVLGVLCAAAWRARDARPRRRLIAASAAALVGFGLALSPYTWAAYTTEERIAVTPPGLFGHQLLLGTNRESVDGYSLRDLERAGFLSDADMDPAALDGAAVEIALGRIADDPLGFLAFAGTEKMERLWASEREILDWSLAGPTIGRAEIVRDPNLVALWRASADAVLVAVLLGALVAAIRLAWDIRAMRDPARWILILSAVLLLALAHVVFEARERHHLAFAPLLALMAPLALVRLELRARWRRAAASWRREVAGIAPDPSDDPVWAPMQIDQSAEAAPSQPSADITDPMDRSRGRDSRGTKTRTAPIRS